MTQEEKDKLQAWLDEARSTYMFIHWEEFVTPSEDKTETIILKEVA